MSVQGNKGRFSSTFQRRHAAWIASPNTSKWHTPHNAPRLPPNTHRPLFFALIPTFISPPASFLRSCQNLIRLPRISIFFFPETQLLSPSKPRSQTITITHSKLSPINLVYIFRCSSSPRDPVYTRHVDPSFSRSLSRLMTIWTSTWLSSWYEWPQTTHSQISHPHTGSRWPSSFPVSPSPTLPFPCFGIIRTHDVKLISSFDLPVFEKKSLVLGFHSGSLCEGEVDFICQVPNLINYQLLII